MNEESTSNPPAAPDASENDIMSLLKRMQQQIAFLEKKIDILISQSQDRASFDQRKKASPKPSHSFDRFQRRTRGEYDRSPRDRESRQAQYYDRRKPEKKRSTGPKVKSHHYPKRDRE